MDWTREDFEAFFADSSNSSEFEDAGISYLKLVMTTYKVPQYLIQMQYSFYNRNWMHYLTVVPDGFMVLLCLCSSVKA